MSEVVAIPELVFKSPSPDQVRSVINLFVLRSANKAWEGFRKSNVEHARESAKLHQARVLKAHTLKAEDLQTKIVSSFFSHNHIV